jgi:hypothetical protein
MQQDNFISTDNDSKSPINNKGQTQTSRTEGSRVIRAHNKEGGQSQTGGMPASFWPSPKRQPGNGSSPNIGSIHNCQDGNENLRHSQLQSLSPPDNNTANRKPNPTARISQRKRNRHYHHRNDPQLTNHKRHSTGKWEPGGHPADRKEQGCVSSVVSGLSKLLGFDQSSIRQTWEGRGQDK